MVARVTGHWNESSIPIVGATTKHCLIHRMPRGWHSYQICSVALLMWPVYRMKGMERAGCGLLSGSVRRLCTLTRSNLPNLFVRKSLEHENDVHTWGRRNRVTFDADKEGIAILHPFFGEGDDFKFLGFHFDVKLTMKKAVDKIVNQVRPKVKAILRTRAFYDISSFNNSRSTYGEYLNTIMERSSMRVKQSLPNLTACKERLLLSFLWQRKTRLLLTTSHHQSWGETLAFSVFCTKEYWTNATLELFRCYLLPHQMRTGIQSNSSAL